MATVTESGRIATLDIIRGVAVMGIFSVNVIAFAMPSQAYFNPPAYGLDGPGDLALWFANFVLVDGKLRALFSMLFGASMLLVIERAQASGLSPASVHYRRMAWLLVFGLAHYYFVWLGDILTLYAAVGMIAFFFHSRPVTSLLVWAGLFLIADMVLLGSTARQMFLAEAAASAPGAPAAAVAAWHQLGYPFARLDALDIAADVARHRAGYAEMIAPMFHWPMAGGPLFQLDLSLFETLGYMLLGMAGLRSGFLKGEWSDRLYRRIAIGALAISIPAFALLGWYNWSTGFHVPTLFLVLFVVTSPFRVAMMIGYAALIILLARSGGPLARRFAATGRAAFTNYLGTSLVAATIFYGFGLGLYGELSRLEAWLFVPPMWAVMLLWSKPWLDRWRYGPFEWLWRSLARGRLQPMRKAIAAPAE